MNRCIILIQVIIWNQMIFLTSGNAKLSALSRGLSATNLYLHLRNRSMNAIEKCIFFCTHILTLYWLLPSSDMPSPSDPATSDAQTRERICQDISGSGFFDIWKLIPVDKRTILRNQYANQSYSDIVHQIYNPTYEYTNEYKEYVFRTLPNWYYTREFVFFCPLKNSSNNQLITFYVSKEYNVGISEIHQKSGRFIFGNFEPATGQMSQNREYVILAEEPAKVYKEPGFNVELHYLRIRKFIELGRKY